jgi:nucleotide-binding universal stress UspA family protein
MKLLEKILIATDLSSSSDELVKHGIDIAKLVGAKIILVYVLNLNTENKKINKFILNGAASQLNRFKKKIIAEGIECDEPIVAKGPIYTKIVEEASINDVNLILMGSNGHSDKGPFKLGNSAKKVIQKTQIPVWVHKIGSNLKINKILCPVDFSDASTRALQNAVLVAKKLDAKLIVMNVYESEHMYQYLDVHYLKDEIEKEREKNETQFKKYLKGINFRDVNWEYYLTTGFPELEILRDIKQKHIDLLSMGTTGRSGLSKFLIGSVTEKVIREVPCSFITTKSKNLIKIVIEAKINDLDTHFREAQLLFNEGLYERALREYNICLEIDNMHIRSYNGMATIYEKMGDQKKAEHYHQIAKEIYDYMWNSKIENEIRKHYQVKGDFHLNN